jgi:hypothetical protein
MWLNFNSEINPIISFVLILYQLLNSLLFFLKNFQLLFMYFRFFVCSCYQIILLKILRSRLEMIVEVIQMELFIPIFSLKIFYRFFRSRLIFF